MHDIWNPWHGCIKCSEGCDNCYMYYQDAQRGKNGADIYKTKTDFNKPVQKNRQGQYKIKSGEMLRVCMTSDFFLEQADKWRKEAWDMMYERRDVIFFLLTKRVQRVKKSLPKDWGDGLENVFFNITCENQKRADERIPILLDLPFKHKGIMCAPFIGEISIKKYLSSGQIEQVIVDGENYKGARPCNFDWVKKLKQECMEYNVRFCFIGTGDKFIKDNKLYHLRDKSLQRLMAYKSGMNFKGKNIEFKLYNSWGLLLSHEEMYKPYFKDKCNTCSSRMICNGCSCCDKCV